MYYCRFLRIFVLAVLSWIVITATSDEDRRQLSSSCRGSTFAQVLPSYAKVEEVEPIPAGSTYGEGARDLNYPIQPTNLPELCAVTIKVTSSLTSSYRFGLFLPAEWTTRFLAVGNGGFGGGINWLDMGSGVQYGFAVVSTDTGHNSRNNDLSWALNDNETRTDWGWRAMHGSVALGKLLVQAYYSRPILYSYYSGCSTGGRQGMKEMQISPQSFDGVLVGSAAWYTSHLNNWVTKAATYNWPNDDPKHISWERFTPLAAEIVKQCDGTDGVEDGIISLPQQCNVNYDALNCDYKVANVSACLSRPQLDTLKNAYSDYVSATGEFLYTGLTPGSEGQMYVVLNYSDGSPYGIGYQRYFVYDDPGFTIGDYNDTVLKYAEAHDPGGATADQYDLADFRDRGGKMMMYHGTADGLVPMKGSDLYYDRVVQAMGGNATATRDFFRYFAVPGMQHCWSTVTDAPWAFGGGSQAAVLGSGEWSVPGFKNAKHDALLALMDWVEKGVAVESVVASTWRTPTNVSTGLLRQRPLCPYPQMARWDGSGNVDGADSWSCGGDISIPPPSSAASGLWNPLSDVLGMFRGLPA